MDDFLKTLQSLDPADLTFLTDSSTKPEKPRKFSKRLKRATSAPAPADLPVAPAASDDSRGPEVMATLIPSDPVTADVTPVLLPPPRKRVHVERDWPPVGTLLSAEYLGQTYRAEIVPAKKRLKSGKQIRLLDGPAKGKALRFNNCYNWPLGLMV